ERVGELALLLDAREDRLAAVLELAQVREARLERAQLRIVEAAGDLLPIARDERYGGTVVEQRDGGLDLRRGGADLGGDGFRDLPRVAGRFGHRSLIRRTAAAASGDCGNRRRRTKALTGRRGCGAAVTFGHGARLASGQRFDRNGMVPESKIRESLPADSGPNHGDGGALSGLRLKLAVLRYGRIVYRVAYLLLADRHEAEDVSQEAFLRYWQHGDSVER